MSFKIPFVIVLILAVILGVVGASLVRKNRMLEEELSALAEAKQDRSEAYKDSLLMQRTLFEDSLRIRETEFKDNLERIKVQTLTAIQEKRLYEIFDDLREYHPGENIVNEKYVVSFEKKGSHIYVKLKNNTRGKIQPSYEITFLNRFGMVAYDLNDYWFFSEIGPGETRIHDEGGVSFPRGEPIYYTVEVN